MRPPVSCALSLGHLGPVRESVLWFFHSAEGERLRGLSGLLTTPSLTHGMAMADAPWRGGAPSSLHCLLLPQCKQLWGQTARSQDRLLRSRQGGCCVLSLPGSWVSDLVSPARRLLAAGSCPHGFSPRGAGGWGLDPLHNYGLSNSCSQAAWPGGD